MYSEYCDLITAATRIAIIQAENPDGDSLGSSLALEEILGAMGKQVSLHCPVDIPKYLRYLPGWDRVEPELDTRADLVIIVDTSAEVLLSKTLAIPGARHMLTTNPVLVIDHHLGTEPDLSFPYTLLLEEAASTSQVIYNMAAACGWPINQPAAHAMLAALLADTLGLTTQHVNTAVYQTAAEILAYKGRLIERIEYLLDGKLALVRIPFSEIEAYSDQYNPSVLVLDEMRLVTGVELAVAIKTYPDGKLTGKLRANSPIAADVAGYFGGGGHPYAAGFRVYEGEGQIVRELVDATAKALQATAV